MQNTETNRQDFIDTVKALLNECDKNFNSYEESNEALAILGDYIYCNRSIIEQVLPFVEFRSQREINDEYFKSRRK